MTRHCHGPERAGLRRRFGARPGPWFFRLQRRLFVSFAFTIAMTAGFVVLILRGVATGEGSPSRWVLAFVVAAVALWLTAARLSRRIARPLSLVVRLAEDLGAGKLDARAAPSVWSWSEERLVAESLNRMAERLQAQLAAERELLAAVSHELRTPLGHMRLIVETAQEGRLDDRALRELERELREMDALVGDVLASSRLGFATLASERLDAGDLARRALERCGCDPGLVVAPPGLSVDADPTLLARALANLVENAVRHAGGPTRVGVSTDGDLVRYEIDDAGPGFDDPARAFEGSRRRARAPAHGTLGLGLALVRRIAVAHGGTAGAENRAGGGARVWLSVRARATLPAA